MSVIEKVLAEVRVMLRNKECPLCRCFCLTPELLRKQDTGILVNIFCAACKRLYGQSVVGFGQSYREREELFEQDPLMAEQRKMFERCYEALSAKGKE